MKEIKKLKVSYDLEVKEENKKHVEAKRYSYCDFSKSQIEKLAQTNTKELNDIRLVNRAVQALFPDKMIAGGLFDSFLVFEIEDGERTGEPIYFFRTLASRVNNSKNREFLIEMLIDLFKENKIEYHKSWDEVFEIIKTDGLKSE